MLERIYRIFIELTNNAFVSKLIQNFSTSRLSSLFIPSYVKVYKIDQSEMANELNSHKTLHELFIRQLKNDVRPISQQQGAIVSPVDAVVEEYGYILPAKEIEVKGKTYSIGEMVGNDKLLEKYIGGQFIILYLSPRDYHRIHSPISGKITHTWALGKKSYPVNKWGMRYGKAPLVKNYRELTEIRHENGCLLVVKVGAMFINSIERTHQGENVLKGEEMAYFTFGSTVVLLFEKDTCILDSSLEREAHVRVGEAIGIINPKH